MFVGLHEWIWFERFIFASIIVNSVFLALQDYSYREKQDRGLQVEENWRNKLVSSSEVSFIIIFSLGSIIKIMGMGFVAEKHTYLRDGWNVLDFLVVISGLLSLIPGIPSLTALRTLRVLRPLRSVSAVPGMKILVTSLLNSLPALANVVIFLFFVFLLFGIGGL